MQHLEGSLMASAISVGIFAAVAVLFAFFKPFRRFARGDRSFADALGAGIWIRAIGTVAAGTAALMRMHAAIWTDFAIGLYLFGWLMVITGYYLHFSAWHGAYFNRRSILAIQFLLTLAIVAAVSFCFFGWVDPV